VHRALARRRAWFSNLIFKRPHRWIEPLGAAKIAVTKTISGCDVFFSFLSGYVHLWLKAYG
jgi:hypothetical protein